MKRIMIAVLAVLLLAAVSAGGVLPVFAQATPVHAHESGAGADVLVATGATPSTTQSLGPDFTGYKQPLIPKDAKPIRTVMEFLSMSADGVYYLAVDLTLTESYVFTADAPAFKGALYGNGHTVTTSVPLFKYIENAVVRDLTIRGDIAGKGVLGAVAIEARTPQLYRVINYANVTSTDGNSVAGLIGNVWNNPGRVVFSYCENHGDITGTAGYNDAGGLAAYMQGNNGALDSSLVVDNCLNTGNVSAGKRLGGLIGCAGQSSNDGNNFYAITVTNCRNTGAVTAQNAAGDQGYYTGGLISRLSGVNVYVSNSVNEGDVYVHKSYGGGLFALAEDANTTLVVENCRNDGAVTTAGQAGGILAIINNQTVKASFINCVNTGDITATVASINAAGILGSAKAASATVDNCLNEGAILSSASNAQNGAGIVGWFSGDLAVTNCTNKGTVTGFNTGTGGIIADISHNDAGGNVIRVYNCVNESTGVLTGAGNCGAGGILAHVTTDKILSVTVELCRNDAPVTSGRPGGVFGVYEISDATVSDTAKTIGSTFLFKDSINNGKVVSPTNYAGGFADRVDSELPSAAGLNGEYSDPVVFVNCTNNAETISKVSHVGGFIGYSRGRVGVAAFYNCTNNGYVHYQDVSATAGNAGGFGGTVDMSIYMEDCVNTGRVDVGGTGYFTGGMIGQTWGTQKMTFKRCTNYADLTGGGVGGTIGKSNGLRITLEDCVNYGKIDAYRNAGGHVSESTKGVDITRCVNMGEVTSETFCAGGIVGHCSDTSNIITKSVNHGNITGAATTGGIVGHYGAANGTQKLISCVNTGDVYSNATAVTDKSHATGGLAGYIYNATEVKYCASLGNVRADFNKDTFTNKTELVAGGFVGYQNCGGNYYTYNYFAGTINAGTQGTAILLKNTIGTSLAGDESSGKFNGNFSINSYPLYYHLLNGAGCVSTTMSTPIMPDTSSTTFINTLNDALADSDTTSWVMVTTCDGDSFPVHSDVAAVLNAALPHTDASYTKQNGDGVNHWNECPECGEIDIYSVEQHTMGVAATCTTFATCAECGKYYGEKDADNHTTEITWQTTMYTHTGVYLCCGATEVEQSKHEFTNGVCAVCEMGCLHEGGNATCAVEAICELCGLGYGGTLNHIYDGEWVADDATDTHYQLCIFGCGAHDTPVACSGNEGTATCSTLAECTFCGQGYGAYSTTHATPDTYKYLPNADDAELCDQYYACCDQFIATAAHVLGTDATCEHKAVCALCGGSYGNVNPENHVFETTWSYADGKHYHACSNEDCTARADEQACSGGSASCATSAICTVCGNAYTGYTNVHRYANDCDADCEDCGTLRSVKAHAFGDWTIVKQPTETESGKQERTCAVCGEKSTVTIAPITNTDTALDNGFHGSTVSNDAYIGVLVIVGAGVLVVGLIAAFIIHKRNKKRK